MPIDTSQPVGEIPNPEDVTDAQWREILSAAEYRVLRESGTEPPGTGRYLDLDADDAAYFACAGCGNRLYAGTSKFHSGCGWPSFFEEVEPGALNIYEDRSHGMVRTEMRCGRCDGHLGHIFPDGPKPTGKRHCVNGLAVVRVPEGASVDETLKAHRAQM